MTPDAPPRRFTDEVVSDRMAEALRAMTPAQRLEVAFGMWRFARDLIRRTAAREHPDWTPAQLDRYVATRMSHGLV